MNAEKFKENFCYPPNVLGKNNKPQPLIKSPGYCHKPNVKMTLVPTNTSWFAEKIGAGAAPGTQSYVIATDEPNYWCGDERPFQFNDSSYMSPNQKLAQGQNPKTLIKPVVVPPSHDLGFWKANNLITDSRANFESQREAYLSGYGVSTCCGDLENKYMVPVDGPQYGTLIGGLDNPQFGEIPCQFGNVQENYRSPKPAEAVLATPMSIPVTNTAHPYTSCAGSSSNGAYQKCNFNTREDFRSPKPAEVVLATPMSIPVTNTAHPYQKCNFNNNGKNTNGRNTKENYDILQTVPDPQNVYIAPNEPGWVNTMCGYNPEQVLENNLPSNYGAGNCQQDPNLSEYNKNLYTQIIQPGVYTRSQINEPINANIGISFQQQFPPLTCDRNDSGLHYTEHDPRIIEPVLYEPNAAVETEATQANVYDPRFSGYGTSYRSYTDPLLGQTRFAYDDVDAIRRPNYIVRSKIDFLPYGDSYGPIKPGQEFGNPLTADIRGLANDSWMRDSLTFRNEMMERQLRRTRADNWQNRIAPKNTMSRGNKC